MANVDINIDNVMGQSYPVSEIAIKETKSKLGKVEILLGATNTEKKRKARKKDRIFLLSLDPVQWVLLEYLDGFQMLTYSIYFDRSISHFTVYMHREGGLFARWNSKRSPEDIIEKYISLAECVQQGEIDSDDSAKTVLTNKYDSTTINIKVQRELSRSTFIYSLTLPTLVRNRCTSANDPKISSVCYNPIRFP